MQHYRDEGPTYPTEFVDEFAEITLIEDCAPDDETVIASAPEALPCGYPARHN